MTEIERSGAPTLSGYELPLDEVHVWRASLEQSQRCMAAFAEVLNSSERTRAERYHFEVDYKRSVIGRGLSRVLLAHCLGETPDSLRFETNAFGKPALTRQSSPSLQFNVSHSGEWVLVALSFGRALGVDVECIRESTATDKIAERFFSPAECRSLAALPEVTRVSAFFACWTRKEAYLKARGDGLSLALDRFDVAFEPDAEPRLLETRHDPGDAGRWMLRDLSPWPGHRAAVAVEGTGWKLRCLDWQTAGERKASPTWHATPRQDLPAGG